MVREKEMVTGQHFKLIFEDGITCVGQFIIIGEEGFKLVDSKFNFMEYNTGTRIIESLPARARLEGFMDGYIYDTNEVVEQLVLADIEFLDIQRVYFDEYLALIKEGNK